MPYSKLYTNKYSSYQIQSSSSIMIMAALCEKAMGFLAAAKASVANGNKIDWMLNLCKVHEVINAMASSIDIEKGGDFAKSLNEFYEHLSLFTSNLISEQIPASKIDDLLESFRINRDNWNDMEKRHATEIAPASFGDKNTL